MFCGAGCAYMRGHKGFSGIWYLDQNDLVFWYFSFLKLVFWYFCALIFFWYLVFVLNTTWYLVFLHYKLTGIWYFFPMDNKDLSPDTREDRN